MTKKRTLSESSHDDRPNETEKNETKRAKLAPSSANTLHDLPIELLESILVKAVVMEVKSMKLVKGVWKEKADLVINRLRAVCSQWNSILTSDYLRSEVHEILNDTAQEAIRDQTYPALLEVVQTSSAGDELFVLCRVSGGSNVLLVYDRQNAVNAKYFVTLPTLQQGVEQTPLRDIRRVDESPALKKIGLIYFVPDTNIFLQQDTSLMSTIRMALMRKLGDMFAVGLSATVLRELDAIKGNRFKSKPTYLQSRAGEAVKLISTWLDSGDQSVFAENESTTILDRSKYPPFTVTNSDDCIIEWAVQLMYRYGRSAVVALTEDRGFRNRSNTGRLKSLNVQNLGKWLASSAVSLDAVPPL